MYFKKNGSEANLQTHNFKQSNSFFKLSNGELTV